MFDGLTLQDLHRLHDQLCAEHRATYLRLMGMNALTAEYAVLSAKFGETGETADAVYAEIVRRDTEHADIYGRTDA